MGRLGRKNAGWLPLPIQLLVSWNKIENFNIYYFQAEMGVGYQFRRLNLELAYMLNQSGIKIEYEEEDKSDYFRSGEEGIILRMRVTF